MRFCTIPGCERPHYAKGRCKRHYMRDWHAKQPPKPRKPREPRGPRGLLGSYQGETAPKSSTLTLWPARPKRITDALHALAERAATEPGWTNERYRAAQDHIKEGGTP